MNRKFALPVVAAVAAVAVLVGVKFAARIRPLIARIPALGKFLA